MDGLGWRFGRSYLGRKPCREPSFSTGITDLSSEERETIAMALVLPYGDHFCQAGIAYFLKRARAMSSDEAAAVLNSELDVYPSFRRSWTAALGIYQDKQQSNPLYDWEQMDSHCHCAVICYLIEVPNVSLHLNHYCRVARPEPASWDAFPFKGLWFFLLMAFEILPPFEVDVVFRGVVFLFIMPDSRVPGLQFLSGNQRIEEVERFALPPGVIVTIRRLIPDIVRDVSFYAADPGKEEILIWPFVTFIAQNVNANHVILYWCLGTPTGCEPSYSNGSDERSTDGREL